MNRSLESTPNVKHEKSLFAQANSQTNKPAIFDSEYQNTSKIDLQHWIAPVAPLQKTRRDKSKCQDHGQRYVVNHRRLHDAASLVSSRGDHCHFCCRRGCGSHVTPIMVKSRTKSWKFGIVNEAGNCGKEDKSLQIENACTSKLVSCPSPTRTFHSIRLKFAAPLLSWQARAPVIRTWFERCRRTSDGHRLYWAAWFSEHKKHL